MKHQRRTTLGILSAPLASALLLLGAGCLDDPDPVPTAVNPPAVPDLPAAPNEPKAYFDQEVYPRLLTTCGKCHSEGTASAAPKYLASSADTAYAAIKGNVKLYQASVDSILPRKGEHEGPALAPDAASAVVHWLDLEIPPSQAPVDPGGGPSNVDEALAEFGKCMDLGDWQQNEMDQFSRTQTLDSGPCMGCHYSGLGGTFLGPDLRSTFEANRTQPYVLKLVEPEFDAQGGVRLVASQRLLDKGNGICPDLDQDDFDICHPEFDFGFNQENEGRLRGFVGQTLGRLNSDGTCPQ
jgi:hypothetical protein